MPRDTRPELLHRPATQGGSEVARVPGLVRRGNRYYFRRRVPTNLQSVIGKTEFTKSLGDISQREAERLARLEQVAADDAIADAERELRNDFPATDLKESEIIHLARRYLSILEKNAGTVPFDDEEREEAAAHHEEELFALGQTAEDPSLQNAALAFADWANVRLDRSHERFIPFCQAFQAAQIEYHQRRAELHRSGAKREFHPHFRDTHEAIESARTLRLDDAIDRFKSAPERSRVQDKTRKDWDYLFDFHINFFGASRDVKGIKRADVRAAQALLLKLPANFSKLFPTEPISEIPDLPAAARLRPMKPQTANRYVRALEGLFRWLVEEGDVERNPAEGIKGPPADRTDARTPLDIDDIKRLLASPEFAREGNPCWVYWLPRIGVFTGMRINEIAGLRTEDIEKIGERYFFRVRPNIERTLKNAWSERLTPAHNQLIKAGLIDHWKALPANSRLFPDIPEPVKGHFNAAQKKIGRKFRKVFRCNIR